MDRLIVTPVEAAQLLRTRPATIRKWCEDGSLPCYREGRNIKIPVAVLEKYVIDRCREDRKEAKYEV